MKTILLALMITSLGTALAQEPSGTEDIRTFCRFVPERDDDFAWENDLVAFRAYGPALRKKGVSSGIDCWLKRVKYPIIDKWYAGDRKGVSYHKDHGEGYDPYHVGASLGCGGTAIWIDQKLHLLETFTRWEILTSTPERSVFTLTFEAQIGENLYQEQKTISIELGSHLFEVSSQFFKNGEPASSLAIAVGITTHDGKAKTLKNPDSGWIACWESIDGFGVGTAVVLDQRTSAEQVVEIAPVKGRADTGHIVFVVRADNNGRIQYRAGYGWAKEGTIKTSEQWGAYLERSVEKINTKEN